jgi:Tol biopolymer transport system component
VTFRASQNTSSIQGNGAASIDRAGISKDGRYVAFTSKATNLVPNDLNNASDVFYRDNLLKTTVCVSVTPTVTPGVPTDPATGPSGSPSISNDGKYVCFVSSAPDVTSDSPDVGTQLAHVYVRNMQTGVTKLVDRASGQFGLKANQSCRNPSISGDGRYVVWDTTASNLDGADPGGVDDDLLSDVYRREWNDPALLFPTILISKSSLALTDAKGNGTSVDASISEDGNFIAFVSSSTNLIPDASVFGPDNGATADIFRRDVLNNATVRVSVSDPASSSFPHPDGASSVPSISSNGRFVVFMSNAANLVPEDDGSTNDIFIRDVDASSTVIVSVHTSGAQAGNGCNFPQISGDGNLVVWQSPSPSLINGDANGVEDIFVRDKTAKTTNRISVATFGGELNGKSLRPNISRDGRYVIFYTEASNAADDDNNGTADFYMRGPPF